MRTAITGGIAEGKSTILQYVAELGFSVASADEIARTVFDDARTNAFLADLLRVDTPVQRSVVRARLVADAAVRRELNAYMHPRIRKAMRELAADFNEVPLLIETCGQADYDRVWVVTCTKTEQFRRMEARYGPHADTQELVRTQLPTEMKIPFADVVIRTNQPEQSVREVVANAALTASAS